MIFFWLVLAIVCLIYYIVCASYAGIGSSFIFIWLMGASFFALIFLALLLEKMDIITIKRAVKIGFVIFMIVGITVFVLIEAFIISGMYKRPKKECDYILVLGCQIRGDRITKSLRKRLDVALEYALEHPEAKIIVSGGQGDDENMSEAEAMYGYLVEAGIDSSRILKEDKSTDTAENMKFSARLIDDPSANVAIVTSNFHISRSLLLARHAGIKNTYGIPSGSDHVLFVNYMVREAIGIVKDCLYGNFF